MSVKTCSDCGVGMEVGFVPDSSRHGWLRSWWNRGEPRPMTFFGLSVGGESFIDSPRSGRLPVTAYRCPECGVLKFYAEKGE